MHDPRFVRRQKPGRDVTDDAKRSGLRELALTLQHRGEIRSLEVGHRDVLDAVDFAEIVNADHVPVGDLAGQDQFLFEPALHFLGGKGISRCFGTNDLERHTLRQLRIPDLIDGAHAANAKDFDDVITGSERLADREGTGIGLARAGRVAERLPSRHRWLRSRLVERGVGSRRYAGLRLLVIGRIGSRDRHDERATGVAPSCGRYLSAALGAFHDQNRYDASLFQEGT